MNEALELRSCQRCVRLGRPAMHPLSDFIVPGHEKSGARARVNCVACRAELYPQGRRPLHRVLERAALPATRVNLPAHVNETRPPAARRLYDRLFTRQRGRCGFCGLPERWLDADGSPAMLVLYARIVNGIRVELLCCHQCEQAVTGARHSPDLLEFMAAVLRGRTAQLDTALMESVVHVEQ